MLAPKSELTFFRGKTRGEDPLAVRHVRTFLRRTAGLIPMPAARTSAHGVVPPAVSAVLQPQPPLAPSIPPVHVVDLMTEVGSRRRRGMAVKEAKLVAVPR